MQKESWRNVFRNKIIKNKYIIIFLSLGLLLWYLFDVFYRPTYTHEFPFTQGEHVWDVDISKHCSYSLGFNFTVPDDSPGDLSQLFGNLSRLRALPASFTVNIFNPHGDKVLMLVPPGRKVFSFAYKSNDKSISLTFSGGGYNKEGNYLAYWFITPIGMSPGRYKVKLNISEVNRELSGFKTLVFLKSSIKFMCS